MKEMLSVLIPLFLGSNVLVAFATLWFTRKKTKAEAEKIIGESYQGLIKSLNERIDKLEKQVHTLETTEDSYIRNINILFSDLRAAVARAESAEAKYNAIAVPYQKYLKTYGEI